MGSVHCCPARYTLFPVTVHQWKGVLHRFGGSETLTGSWKLVTAGRTDFRQTVRHHLLRHLGQVLVQQGSAGADWKSLTVSQARNGVPWVTTVGPETEVPAASWGVTAMAVCAMDPDSHCFPAVCRRGSVIWLVKVAVFEGGPDTEVEASSWDEHLQYAAGRGGLVDAG